MEPVVSLLSSQNLPLVPLMSKMNLIQNFHPCLFNFILPPTVPVFIIKLSCIKNLYAFISVFNLLTPNVNYS